MKGIMSARTKNLELIESVPVEAYTKIDNFDLPPAKSSCRMIPPDDMDLLVELLHSEAKVI